jgi:hypothetical protein
MRSSALVLLALATLSCSSSTGPSSGTSDPAILQPRSAPDGLILSNPTDQTIYYAVFERRWAEEGLFIWAQCTDAPRCPSIPPGGAVRVPPGEISGYFPGAREARVYYWRLVGSKGGYHVIDLRTMVVPF